MGSDYNLSGLFIMLLGSTLPMLFLIGLGFLSRKFSLLQKGDERVFSSYVYYFALPGLFITNLSQTPVTGETLSLLFLALLPMAVILIFFIVISLIFRISRGPLSLMIICTLFGSVVFFGIPYIIFLFGTKEAEYFATVSAVPISIAGWFVSIITLEFYSLRAESVFAGALIAAKRILKNPLIISMAVGMFLSLSGISLPGPVREPLRMLGRTTSTIAMFLVGMFFYGREYSGFCAAFKLSLLRMALLPASALLFYLGTGRHGTEVSVLVLMHGMPAAVNLIVLSERYNFYKNLIPAFLIVSTFGSFITLGFWFLLTA